MTVCKWRWVPKDSIVLFTSETVVELTSESSSLTFTYQRLSA